MFISNQNLPIKELVDYVEEALFICDVDLNILFLNNTAADVFSFTDPQNFIDKKIYEVIRDPDLVEFFNFSIKNKAPLVREFKVLLKKYMYLSVKSDYVNDDLILYRIKDVSRFKRADKRQKYFIANASHELRTPLTIIKGAVETVSTAKNISDENKKMLLDKAAFHCDRMQMLLQEFLMLTRLEDDPNFQLKSKFKLANIITKLKIAFKSEDHPSVDFEYDFPEELLINANEILIFEIIVNLFQNAINYNPDQNLKLQLKIKNSADEVTFQVIDNGVGIQQSNIDRIFDRFFRGDPSRNSKVSGTGMGLSIVKGIVDIHDGEINVDSDLGVKTTFTIKLPA